MLRLNALNSIVFGVVLATVPGRIDELLDTGRPGWIRVVGLGLVPFGRVVRVAVDDLVDDAAADHPQVVAGDVAWLGASAATVLLGWYSGVGVVADPRDGSDRRCVRRSTVERMATSAHDALIEVRRICLALPETSERLGHGAPTFFVREKKTFTTFHDDHHGDGRMGIWCPAAHGVQEQMVEAEPERFYRPPYVGGRGWLGVNLGIDPDWDEVAGVVEEAFRHVAPKTVLLHLRS